MFSEGALQYFCPMTIAFEKYHGTGNDFIMVDNRAGTIQLSPLQVQQLCDRHFGVGSDGLILIEEPKSSDEHFYMNFYNPDGSSSFCGNGSRCAVFFASKLGIRTDRFLFSAIDGRHEASIEGNLVSVKMRDVQSIQQVSANQFFVHTGSPHVIAYVSKGLSELALVEHALPIRHHEDYLPGGTNVNFIQQESNDRISIRTFERGVEDETLSCGTGVTAAALVHGAQHKMNHISVASRGGNLEVKFEGNTTEGFRNIFLIGPAQAVYSGIIHLK